jgi:hypothetical protein
MKTNHIMLKELLEAYTPAQRGFASAEEMILISNTLHLNEMDIRDLRNLRDYTVLKLGMSKSLVDWDRMSAITYVIDCQIVELGGAV